jgi:uncharacterized protein
VTMRRVAAFDTTRSQVLGAEVAVADRWWTRLTGLLFRPHLRQGEGLLLKPCRAVHTCGMRYPIDVAYLDADGAIVGLWHEVPPGLRLPWCRAAASVLELPARTFAATGAQVGDLVRME